MIINKIKELFTITITIIIFSSLLFANSTVDTSFFDSSSEKVLDLEEDSEQDDDEQEKNTFFLIKNFSFYNLYVYQPRQVCTQHAHSHQDNTSLFKPPILFS